MLQTPQQFTPGDVVLFRAYWWRLFGPVQTLARVNDMIQRAMAAARRGFEVLDAPDEVPDAPDAAPLQNLRGGGELRNVSFSYGQELPARRDTGVPPVRGASGNGESLSLEHTRHGRDARVTSVVLHNV